MPVTDTFLRAMGLVGSLMLYGTAAVALVWYAILWSIDGANR